MNNIFINIIINIIYTIILGIFINFLVKFLTSNYVIDIVNRICSITNGKPLMDIRVKSSVNVNTTITDYFIFTSIFASRSVEDFKYFIEVILSILSDEYYHLPDQQFSVVISFFEVDHDSELGVRISEPLMFTYDVINPLSVNELFNAINFFDLAFDKIDNKDVVVTIKIVTPIIKIK